jgi:hypothetical protein
MHILITFQKNGRTLTAFPYPVEKEADYRDGISKAYEQFVKENPKVNLFDGVNVVFDRINVSDAKPAGERQPPR